MFVWYGCTLYTLYLWLPLQSISVQKGTLQFGHFLQKIIETGRDIIKAIHRKFEPR